MPQSHRRRHDGAHLLARTSFGPTPESLDLLLDGSFTDYLADQLDGDTPEPELETALETTPWINASVQDVVDELRKTNFNSPEPLQRVVRDMSIAKILRAVMSPNQLREVMADFWFNHFNVNAFPWPNELPGYERRAIRPHALGRFRDLLGAVAHSPTMLYYLDNYINVADRIENGELVRGLNENYSRELLELHTVGVDAGYTQQDIIDAARVLTGWTFSGWWLEHPTFDFVFDAEAHDWGAKQVFGLTISESGESEGEQLLDYLASHPKTARFICRKLAFRFVADDPPESLVERCASVFLETDGDIARTLEEMFVGPEFWADEFRANKFKTPFEYVVSSLRALKTRLRYPKSILDALRNMGMPLYEEKSPRGYPVSSAEWMNPASQVHRFEFAFALSQGKLSGVSSPLVNHRRKPHRQSAPGARAATTLIDIFHQDILTEGLTIDTSERAQALASSDGVTASEKTLGLLLASPEFALK